MKLIEGGHYSRPVLCASEVHTCSAKSHDQIMCEHQTREVWASLIVWRWRSRATAVVSRRQLKWFLKPCNNFQRKILTRTPHWRQTHGPFTNKYRINVRCYCRRNSNEFYMLYHSLSGKLNSDSYRCSSHSSVFRHYPTISVWPLTPN